MSPVAELVNEAAALGYPALAITDHGRVASVVEHYRTARQVGIEPAPGTELYVTPDHSLRIQSSMHLTVVSYTPQGYRNLVGLNNLAQRQRSFGRPRVDFGDLASLAEHGLLQGLALGTGCRSGPVVKALVERDETAARQVIEALAGWFPRVYVELMNHHFAADGWSDRQICDALAGLAREMSLPMILSTDTHYTRESDQELHDAMKALVWFGADPAEAGFNGSGYWLRGESELLGYPYIEECLQGLEDLSDRLKVSIPELDTFALRIPDLTLVGTQHDELHFQAATALAKWLADKPKVWTKRYMDRLLAELEVVKMSGFAGYLLLIGWLCDWMRENKIWFHVRGSASGSLILYVLGVTQLDPVARQIRFDRFLSPDRSSPPDVDIDIEHTRRDEVVNMARERYPVLQVGTTMTLSISGHADDDEDAGEEENPESGKGSLLIKYNSVKRKQAVAAGEDPKTVPFLKWAEIPAEDKAVLRRLSDQNLVSGRGAHPGGYVIAADEPSVAFMPLESIGSSKTMVTSLDKDDVEAFGLPKIDLLGSKVLTAVRIAAELVCDGDGREWYDAIPENDKKTIRRAAKGKTMGAFQFTGRTNRRVTMEIEPKNIEDLVAVQALGRPAPMQAGFTRLFMDRRFQRAQVPDLHEDIALETKDTYGLAIYQEQLVGVLRRLGLDATRLTRLLKAVKASGKAHAEKAAKVMASELEPLQALARSRGWSEDDVAWLTSCLHDYGAGYSFGKAHAFQYAQVGFRTMWLAEHEPLAYWTGMLISYTGAKNSYGDDLEQAYRKAARDDGVKVFKAHVEHSGVIYTPEPESFAVREGLTSIGGVGVPAATELIAHRPFASLIDLAQRVAHGKVTGCKKLLLGVEPGECGGTIQALYQARALDGIPPGEPIRRAKGRIRRCQLCKHTYATPLEYEDHFEAEHLDPEGDRDAPA